MGSKKPKRILFGKLTGNVYPQWAFENGAMLRRVSGTVVHVRTSASHVLVDTDLRIKIMEEQLDFSENPYIYVKSKHKIIYLIIYL